MLAGHRGCMAGAWHERGRHVKSYDVMAAHCLVMSSWLKLIAASYTAWRCRPFFVFRAVRAAEARRRSSVGESNVVAYARGSCPRKRPAGVSIAVLDRGWLLQRN